MADYSNHEHWIRIVDNRLNDPAYNKPKYKLVNTQLKVLRMQLVETKAGLFPGGYVMAGASASELCRVIDFVSSFL